MGERASEILAKPWVLLVREPVLFAVTMYMAFVYGTLVRRVLLHAIVPGRLIRLCWFFFVTQYMLFEAYPIVFHGVYGFNAGITGLMFLPILVGNAIGCLTVRKLVVLSPLTSTQLNSPYFRLFSSLVPNMDA